MRVREAQCPVGYMYGGFHINNYWILCSGVVEQDDKPSTGTCHPVGVTATLGENCALAANQSVDCRATILFTISLNSAKV